MSHVNIHTSNLAIGYGKKVIRQDINLSLMEGELVCLLGPNGCGKSTLLRTLSGLQPALSGSITMGDLLIDASSSSAHTDHRLAETLALVLTERLSMENTTVHDVVALGRYPYTSFLGGLSTRDEQEIIEALKDVGLSHKATDYFNACSDGEKQRILIAKAIAQQTPVILLDEPTAHLDLPSRIHTLLLLRTLAHAQKKTILISTHELDLALKMSDRILLMSDTTIMLDTADHLREQGAFEQAFKMDIFHPLGM